MNRSQYSLSAAASDLGERLGEQRAPRARDRRRPATPRFDPEMGTPAGPTRLRHPKRPDSTPRDPSVWLHRGFESLPLRQLPAAGFSCDGGRFRAVQRTHQGARNSSGGADPPAVEHGPQWRAVGTRARRRSGESANAWISARRVPSPAPSMMSPQSRTGSAPVHVTRECMRFWVFLRYWSPASAERHCAVRLSRGEIPRGSSALGQSTGRAARGWSASTALVSADPPRTNVPRIEERAG
jgi:hypothetical protein